MLPAKRHRHLGETVVGTGERPQDPPSTDGGPVADADEQHRTLRQHSTVHLHPHLPTRRAGTGPRRPRHVPHPPEQRLQGRGAPGHEPADAAVDRVHGDGPGAVHEKVERAGAVGQDDGGGGGRVQWDADGAGEVVPRTQRQEPEDHLVHQPLSPQVLHQHVERPVTAGGDHGPAGESCQRHFQLPGPGHLDDGGLGPCPQHLDRLLQAVDAAGPPVGHDHQRPVRAAHPLVKRAGRATGAGRAAATRVGVAAVPTPPRRGWPDRRR